MTNELTTFPFQAGDVNQNVRVVAIDGKPWFVAADVCRALGRSNPSMALRLLGVDEKTLIQNEALFGKLTVNCITESGLYKLVMRSDKPQARAFQDWVARISQPSVRTAATWPAKRSWRRASWTRTRSTLRAWRNRVPALFVGRAIANTIWTPRK